jgi:hypothetical protein
MSVAYMPDLAVVCDFSVGVGVGAGVKPGTKAKALEMVTVLHSCISKKGSILRKASELHVIDSQ